MNITSVEGFYPVFTDGFKTPANSKSGFNPQISYRDQKTLSCLQVIVKELKVFAGSIRE